jgi:hypothetical protein
MEFQQGQAYTGAPFPDVEYGEKNAILSVPASGQIAYGEVVCRDITQLSGGATWNSFPNQAGQSAPANYQQQPDMVVPANNAAAGMMYGILKYVPPKVTGYYTNVQIENGTSGAPSGQIGIFNQTSATIQVPCQVRWLGYTGAWCKVLGTGSSGVTINVGTLLQDNATNSNLLVGHSGFVGNAFAGMALATVLSGTLTSGVGSALVTAGASTQYAFLNVDLRIE